MRALGGVLVGLARAAPRLTLAIGAAAVVALGLLGVGLHETGVPNPAVVLVLLGLSVAVTVALLGAATLLAAAARSLASAFHTAGPEPAGEVTAGNLPAGLPLLAGVDADDDVVPEEDDEEWT